MVALVGVVVATAVAWNPLGPAGALLVGAGLALLLWLLSRAL